MAEPLILINGPIDQLSSVLPHITKPAGFQKIPCQKRALSSGLGVKGWTLEPVPFQGTLLRSRAVNWGMVGYLWPPEHFCFDLRRVSRFSTSTASTATFPSPSFPISSKKPSQGYIPKRKSIPNSTWGRREPAQLLLELCWVFGTKTFCTALEVAQFGARKISQEKDAHNLNDTEYSITVMS